MKIATSNTKFQRTQNWIRRLTLSTTLLLSSSSMANMKDALESSAQMVDPMGHFLLAVSIGVPVAGILFGIAVNSFTSVVLLHPDFKK